MKASTHVRVSGPLARHAVGFAARLTEQGYTALSLANQLRLMAHFSRWLAQRRLEPDALTASHVDRYLATRRKTRTAWRSRRGLAPLLSFLELTEAVAPLVPKQNELLERYDRHLVERGLSAAVRAHYLVVGAELLQVCAPHELTGANVMRFARQLLGKPHQNGRLSALRSVLRFLHVEGETPSFVSIIPSTTSWRLASLPRALEPTQIRAVLASPDRRTAIGARDYAALLLMLRLGLRACEVAAIALDDLDWARGELVVRGKGTTGRLPLPRDVGEALVGWLRRRRRGVPTRSVFLGSRAPYRAASASTISHLAGRALRDAGVATGGGHRLRHTAATMMLRRGASMTEIAQVLRHRHVDTTAIYAKVDREGLRALAQPWPEPANGAQLRALSQPWPGGVS
jgi:integrase/recombinase XerD